MDKQLKRIQRAEKAPKKAKGIVAVPCELEQV
jgi:hypothetical protein